MLIDLPPSNPLCFQVKSRLIGALDSDDVRFRSNGVTERHNVHIAPVMARTKALLSDYGFLASDLSSWDDSHESNTDSFSATRTKLRRTEYLLRRTENTRHTAGESSDPMMSRTEQLLGTIRNHEMEHAPLSRTERLLRGLGDAPLVQSYQNGFSDNYLSMSGNEIPFASNHLVLPRAQKLLGGYSYSSSVGAALPNASNRLNHVFHSTSYANSDSEFENISKTQQREPALLSAGHTSRAYEHYVSPTKVERQQKPWSGKSPRRSYEDEDTRVVTSNISKQYALNGNTGGLDVKNGFTSADKSFLSGYSRQSSLPSKNQYYPNSFQSTTGNNITSKSNSAIKQSEGIDVLDLFAKLQSSGLLPK